MSGIWSTWMRVWCWGVLAFGALLTTAAIPPIDGLARALFVLFSGDPSTEAVFDLPAVRFGLGLQGALTIGWALTLFATLRAAEELGAIIWRPMALAVLAWYVIDSAISISTGFALNAVSNTLLTIAFFVPLLASGALKRGKGAR